jgi:predicted transcriptional regulator
MTDKETVLALLKKLPDSATLEEIAEEVAVLSGVRRGKKDADAGRIVSHEEVKQRSAQWNSR